MMRSTNTGPLYYTTIACGLFQNIWDRISKILIWCLLAEISYQAIQNGFKFSFRTSNFGRNNQLFIGNCGKLLSMRKILRSGAHLLACLWRCIRKRCNKMRDLFFQVSQKVLVLIPFPKFFCKKLFSLLVFFGKKCPYFEKQSTVERTKWLRIVGANT